MANIAQDVLGEFKCLTKHEENRMKYPTRSVGNYQDKETEINLRNKDDQFFSDQRDGDFRRVEVVIAAEVEEIVSVGISATMKVEIAACSIATVEETRLEFDMLTKEMEVDPTTDDISGEI
ncbi:hypothetical protein CDAR_523571 [Caerostris darwini]|uniref:Uncharacterized protein n=1 Tax=Caerostris darwini TaxID=1538125 RepID=A0AAV4WUX8_9ARAC|nr:hypothetical protein CDAR_523571 [Caerostris darwini]